MRIKFVSCTAGSRLPTVPIVASAEKQSFVLELLEHNKKGLSEQYNEVLKRERVAKEYDAVVFVHDDVYVTDAFWKEKLEKGFEEYDIIGIAGTSKVSLKNMKGKVCWHNSPKDGWAGSVEHMQKDGKFTWNYFGPTPREVATIDGLFMALKIDTTRDIKFDEEFTFDFYDFSLCLNAYMMKKKIGVVNVHCTHMSLGEGIMNSRYDELQEKFLKKWKS